jgi:putative transposase
MNFDQDIPPRRNRPVHGILYVDGQPTIIFDTVCTKDRIPWLANADVHERLRTVWTNATAWLVGRYVIMPDHVHYFAAAADPQISYENWVKYWKSQFTKQHKNPSHRWQTDHWDRRMRSEHAYEEKWSYVLDNPIRKGLVTNIAQWPYQGEIYDISWR